MEIREIQVASGGWITIPGEGRIRFRAADDGRLEPVAVEVLEGTVSNRTLQRFPFGRIESIANSPKVAELIRERIDISDSSKPVRVDLRASPSEGRALVGRLKETIADPPRTEGGRIVYPEDFFEGIASLYGLYVAGIDLAVKEHGDGKHSERSLERARTLVPVKWMAGELDVPITSVRRWVRVCRDRELLSQPRHGKGG